MTLQNSNTSALAVHKLSIECLVPGGQQNAYNIHDRIRKLASSHLGVAIETALKPLDRNDNDGLVFLRRLEIEFDFDLALSPSRIAHRWAEILKNHLIKRLNQPAASENIIYFPSRKSYIGRFLRDLAHGVAWQTWYYREFDGLKALPLSAALRTAILNEPAKGLEALLTLDDFDLTEVVNSLTIGDVAIVFDNLTSGSTGGAFGELSIVNLLADSLAKTPRIYQLLDGDTRRAALYLCLNLCRQADQVSLDSIKPLVHAFVLLAHIADHEHRGKFDGIIAAVRMGKLSSLAREMSSDRFLKLQPLFELAKKKLDKLLTAIADSVSGQSIYDKSSTENRFTFFGNVFLLLPRIKALPLQTASQTWPEIEDDNKVAILRWLTLALCQGTRQFRRALRDPVIRDLCGINPKMTETQALEWLNNIGPNQREAFFCQLGQWLLEGQVKPVKKFKIKSDEITLTIYQEIRKGSWFYVSPSAVDSDQVPAAFSEIVNGKNISTKITEGEIKTNKADVITLFPAPNARLSPEASSLLMVLAQTTLKHLAYRLPGFAQSSVDYLLKNFLPMSAKLVMEEQRILVLLSKAPMNVILNMTGINRQQYVVEEFDSLPIYLCQGG